MHEVGVVPLIPVVLGVKLEPRSGLRKVTLQVVPASDENGHNDGNLDDGRQVELQLPDAEVPVS